MKKIIFALLFLIIMPVHAEFIEGKSYYKVPENMVTEIGDKVTVKDFFWYGCPHCYHARPYIDNWFNENRNKVELTKIPAAFHKVAILHAKLFHTFELIEKDFNMHSKVFEAMHVKNNRLDTEEKIFKFVSSIGLDISVFKPVFNSFAVETFTKKGHMQFNKYKLKHVPTVVVGNYITGEVTSYDELTRLMSYLVDKNLNK